MSSYVRPALSLWGEGGTIARGLYEAYQEFGVSLNDISALNSDSVGGQGAIVKLGERSQLTFKFDRIEATVRNYLKDDLLAFPGLVARCEDWLRAAVPNHQFAFRVFEVNVHASLNDGTAESVLRGLGVRELDVNAVSRSHGASYHFTYPDLRTRVDLLIDHSLVVIGGLYVHFGMVIEGDMINYVETTTWAERTMRALLAAAGLTFAEPFL